MLHIPNSKVVSEDKLKMMVSRADKNSTGYISEDDFFEAFDWLIHQTQDERDYAAIFNMLVSEEGVRRIQVPRREISYGFR